MSHFVQIQHFNTWSTEYQDSILSLLGTNHGQSIIDNPKQYGVWLIHGSKTRGFDSLT